MFVTVFAFLWWKGEKWTVTLKSNQKAEWDKEPRTTGKWRILQHTLCTDVQMDYKTSKIKRA